MEENKTQNFIDKGLFIEDANVTFRNYFFKNYWWVFIIVGMVFFILFYTGYFYVKNASKITEDIVGIIGVILLLGMTILGAFVTDVKEKIFSLYFSQFAQANDLNFRRGGSLPDSGAVFYNSSRVMRSSNEVSGNLGKFPFRLFTFDSHEVSDRKQGVRKRKNIELTVFELTLNSSFPKMLLIPVTNSIFLDKFAPIFSKELIQIKPKQDYVDFFEIFIKPGYEIEAYQIFSPQFLDFLVKHSGQKFYLNFIGDKLYIFKNGITSKRVDLLNMYAISLQTISIIGDLSQRLKDDFEALHPYFKNNK